MIYVVRYALVALYTVIWGIPAVLIAPFSGEAIVFIGRNWIRWIYATCGIRVEVEGLDNVDPAQPVVFMSNHQSVIDIGAIVLSIPVSWRFVAKKELTYIPFFGWALGLSDQIIIDRSKRERSVKSLQAAAGRIRDGINVIVFPEGSRSPDGQLTEFKSGGFHLAIEAGVPILPVTVSGSMAITPKRSLRIESGTVKVVYGKPIPTEGLEVSARHQLKEVVRTAIAQGFDPELQG